MDGAVGAASVAELLESAEGAAGLTLPVSTELEFGKGGNRGECGNTPNS